MIPKLSCPDCWTELSDEGNSLFCTTCQRHWRISSNIPRFVNSEYYWGEVTQAEMKEINSCAEDIGWDAAVKNLVKPKYQDIYNYIIDQNRADFSFLTDLSNSSVALDIGSGWGTITCLLAERAACVWSIEGVAERIEFTKIRAEQSELHNVFPIQASFLEMPLPKNTFDLVVLNGVLEWIGIADYNQSPDQLQKRVLTKILDSLRPGGTLYIGIENRFSYQYFLGSLDHSDLPFTSLLPRWLADIVMKYKSQGSRRTLRVKGSYRTYTYSYWGYQSLLKDVGFDDVQINLVFPDYNNPSYIVSPDSSSAFSYLLENLYQGTSTRRKLLRNFGLIASRFGLHKFFVPSYGIYAQKGA